MKNTTILRKVYSTALLVPIIFTAGCATPSDMVKSEPTKVYRISKSVSEVAYCISRGVDDYGMKFNTIKAPDDREVRITVAAPKPTLSLVNLEETAAVFVITPGRVSLHQNAGILYTRSPFKKLAEKC